MFFTRGENSLQGFFYFLFYHTIPSEFSSIVQVTASSTYPGRGTLY
jgi:hypothetical protein